MDDSRQLTIAGTVEVLARPLHERFLDAMSDAWAAVLEPHSPATREAYHRRWKHWCAFCEAMNLEPLPIDVGRLLGYLELLSETHAPNTVRLALSALSSLDSLSRITPAEPDPQSLAKSAAVQRWMQSWSREHPRAPRKRAAVVRPKQLAAILEASREPASRQSRMAHVQRYARDRALMLIGFCSACRVSELVALDAPGDVETTDRGLIVHIRRGKTDQDGRGRSVVVLPQGNVLMCPVDAWRQWMAVRGSMDGPAFAPIDRQGTVLHEKRLTKRSVQRLIAERATRAGVELVSSHSMRRSMATIALEKGRNLAAIRKQGRWASFDSLAPYIEDAELFKDNPSSGLLDEEI